MCGWLGVFRECPPLSGPYGFSGCSFTATLDIHRIHIEASLYYNWKV